MKLNWRESQGKLMALALIGGVLLAPGCNGEESGGSETTKPTTLGEDARRLREELKRDREMSREEMAQLVTEIEELVKKAQAVREEYAALMYPDNPRRQQSVARDRGAGTRKIKLDGFRRRLKAFSDEELPILGPHIREVYDTELYGYQQDILQLEMVKNRQQ